MWDAFIVQNMNLSISTTINNSVILISNGALPELNENQVCVWFIQYSSVIYKVNGYQLRLVH